MHWRGTEDGWDKYGHNGSSVGTRTVMLYMPKADATLVVASNLGGVIESENTDRFSPMIVELLDILLEREGG